MFEEIRKLLTASMTKEQALEILTFLIDKMEELEANQAVVDNPIIDDPEDEEGFFE